MRRAFLLLLIVVFAFACSTSGTLDPPTSDNTADDPCDPSTGSSGGVSNAAVDAGAAPITLPGTPPGIAFDDLRFSGDLSQLIVPAGRTGDVDFIDPSSELVSSVGGFSTSPTYTADTNFGVMSADEGNGLVFTVDRTSNTLAVIDWSQEVIVSKVSLSETPGYVRFVEPTNEVWVTEPSSSQIVVFTLASDTSTAPVQAMTIPILGGGPGALEVDAVGGRAYTNGMTSTIAIDIATHAVVATWPNQCTPSGGIALDTTNHWAMVACQQGLLVVLSTADGSVLGMAPIGSAVQGVSYDPVKLRLYAPSPKEGTMAVISLSSAGVPTSLGSLDSVSDSHCVVSIGLGQVYVCAPSDGELLLLRDPF